MNKQDVARSFSRAASTYDQAAVLQRHVGQTLLAMIPPAECARVVDLGCGTGHFLSPLREQTLSHQVIALDIAYGMLAQAKSAHDNEHLDFCGADAEQLPLRDNSVDVIFANLVLQWCSQLHDVFREVQRVLTPGGCLLFSTFGPASLQELRTAWSKVDDYVHVNRFMSLTDIQRSVQGMELTMSNRVENILRFYPRLNDLTYELKALGAHNVNMQRPPGLTGRRRMQMLHDSYEQLRDEEKGLPATYEIFYVQVIKPNE